MKQIKTLGKAFDLLNTQFRTTDPDDFMRRLLLDDLINLIENDELKPIEGDYMEAIVNYIGSASCWQRINEYVVTSAIELKEILGELK